ncbi:MAG TPA: molybdenum cofactor guanylyltransferase [Candidatus Limnocylindrales bacterium]|nr:molybdenum cofactor guanylyltransferase [Candidatus Limnocylindrales bacterium]
MSGLPAVTGAVLAGGRSQRFGGDKLRARLEGRSLLEHAVAAVATLADEVLVVGREAWPPPGAELRARPDRRIRAVADRVPAGGPAAGLRTALEVAREPIVLVVAGDMPRLAPAVLELLVRTLAAAEPGIVDAVALAYRGRLQPLPAALRVGAGTIAAQAAVASGDTSLTGVLARMPVRLLEEAAWRPLDPAASTLADVDRPADLDRLARGR